MSDDLDTASAVSNYLKSREPQEAVRTSFTLAAESNPDAEAEYRRLAKQSGIPIDSVRDNKEAVQRQVSAPDYGDLAKRFPSTTAYLSTLENARVAHDDVGGLTEIEKAIRGFSNGGGARIKRPELAVMNSTEYSAAVRRARQDNPALDDDAARALVMGGTEVNNQAALAGPVRGQEVSAGSVISGLAGAARRMPEVFDRQLSRISADILGLDTTQISNRLAALETQNISQTPAFETETGKGLYAGGVSTIQNAPGMAMSIATGNPAFGLGMAGAQSAVPAYSKYRDRGASGGMAAVGALAEGAVEVATELLPMQSLLKVFGKSGQGAAMQFLKSQFQEQWTEQIATVAQDAIDTAIANPNKTWAEYVAERPGAAYQTFLATLVQTGAVTIAHTAAQKVTGAAFTRNETANRAEEAAATAENLTQLVQASKLRERDPESFAQFVNQVAEDSDTPTELYIDGETLINTLNQAGITMERLAMVAPAVAAQLRAASFVPGADIRVPVAEFAAAGADITTPLIDHLRETPDAMSRAEAQEYLKTEGDRIQGDVEAELGKMTDSIGFQQRIAAVQAQFEEQLNSAGKFRPEVNKAYASLLGNFYGATAARAGLTPQELLDRYQLRVTSKTGQGVQTLEQGASLDSVKAQWDAAGIRNSISEKDGTIELSQIIVPEGKRGAGAGTQAMKQLLAYADATEKRVVLTPSADFGGTKTRLVKFYKGLGFVENKGKGKDFSTMAGMIREPQKGALARQPSDAEAFARMFGPATAMTVTEVQKAVTMLSSRWKSGPKIMVVDTPADLPGERPADARGLLHDGIAYIVAKNHVSRDAIARTLAHEVVGHYGLLRMIGADAVEDFGNKVQAGIEAGNEPLVKLRDKVRAMYVDEAGNFNLSPEEEASEIAAFAVEAAIDPATGEFRPGFELAKQVWAKVAEFLRKLGLDVKFTDTELHGMLVSAMRGLEAGKKLDGGGEVLVLAARGEAQAQDVGVADALLELGKLDSTFQSPKSEATDLAEIAADKGGTVKVDQETVTQPDNTERPTGNWTLTLPDGEQGTMTERDGEVYLNVAGLKEGGGGNSIYDLAANYALNNGLRFIGDPAGLSQAAMRRRLENMLSSAVKYGTTEHIQPHPDQLKGNAKIGVPALKWTEGDTAGNILSMVEASVAATASTNPVATENVKFDAATQSFVDGDNHPLDAADLRALLGFDERTPGTGQAGVATLQRNALFRTLLSGPDARRAFLGSVRGQQGEPGAGAGATRGTFYQDVEADGGPRATLNFAADITQAPSVIALLEGADLTSFVHESGHFFLEVQADLAARIEARISSGQDVSVGERAIVEDMNTLLAWFGVNATLERSAIGEWTTRTLEERREAHETFARGFERYAMEGKAPTLELQGLFNKFRSWLVSVYQKLASLNVNLTDDVRAVMDRMLASDEAIQEAQAARNMGPLFQSPEQAGMTAKEYDAYQFLGERATAAASEELDARLLKDLKWLSRAKDKAIKAAQAEADDMRRDTEMEVRREVMSEDIYRAWSFLTGKLDALAPGTVAPDDITGMESGKLRTSLVKDIDAESWSRLSERRMTSEDRGMHPDIVADVFGFSSGDELVRKLAAAPPPAQVIAELVDQRMMERYGDITSPEALSRAADEAVHNELRARVIATEMKALQKAGQVLTGDRNTVSVLARAAKDFAAQIIARQRVRDLRPSQYTAAEARSAKLAEQAMGKDMATASLHKRNQLINNYAARAAYDAQAEVKAMQAYFRKFDKRRDSIDAGYQDQIEALLERFDFKPAPLKLVDKRKSFAAWYAEQEEAGNPPDVPEELLDESRRQSYKDMTVEELRGLRDTVKQIEHQGRLKNKLLLARDKRDFDAAATGLANSIIEHGGKARPEQLEGPNPVTDWFAGLAASHRKLASLFRQMDGNKDSGPMYDLIGRGMNERGTMEDVMVEKATEALREIYAPMLKLKGGITGYRSKVFIPELVRAGETDAEAKKKYSMTRGGRLAVALNWGNEANRQRIMDGDKWTAGQVQAILKTLTPEELKFVNDVWAYIDSYWEEIAAKEKRLTGVEPEKVEAMPFTVTAADGTEVSMRGGYYPLKYDTDRSDRADTQEAAQAAKEMMQGVMTKATTRRGHTKERLKEVKRAVRKDLNVITQHITQVTHDLAWHEWLMDTNKLLADGRVVSAIRDHYGPKVLKTIRDDVMGIATADVVPQTDVDKALLALRGNVTRATMGASLTTAFLQPFGLTQSIVRIGPQHVLRGMARWGGDAARMENTVEWIRGKSEFMRLRAKTFNKELREIRGSVAGKSQTMRVIDAGLFALMQKMQMVADVPTWVGQYEKSTAEGLDEAAAVAMADRAVLESQGGGATKDLAEVQRKHPMLTQFYSYFSVTLNLAAEQTAATDFKNPAAVAGWLGDMALLMVIPAILPPLIMFAIKGGDGDDEKGWAKRIAQWQLGYLMGTVVGLRELSGAVSGFDYAGPPVGRIIAAIGKVGKQTAQGEVDEPLVLAVVDLLGATFGIPTVQAMRSYKGWKAWDEGRDGAGPQSVLFGPPPKD